MTALSLRKFSREDFPEYSSWYLDPAIQRELGPIDRTWLDFIMEDREGIQLVVHEGEVLVAVVGLVFKKEDSSRSAITDFAVNPVLQNQGYGSLSLNLVVNKISNPNGQLWSCYVSPRNLAAQYFFSKNGWEKQPLDSSDMIPFVLAT